MKGTQTMKQLQHAFLAALLAAPALALAQAAPTTSVDVPAKAPAAATAMAEGEVRKVDKEAGKITVRHGLIASLDMPPMTMVFRVADPKMLDAVKEGDKVNFAAERRNGAITITTMEAAKP